ncbi:hypothetical protein ACRQ1B_28640 [Rhizobium panacihumi]|uniref:hypothetical protein n=1 Tax=Rhizobium panacihumi TaxID=2008450 RepID=UPI003D7AE457
MKIAIGLVGIIGAVVAIGVLHSVVETKTGYRPFTRQRLTLLSFVAALYHGAFYLADHTGYLAGKPWAFPAMVAGAAILGGVVIFQNFKHAGIVWGAVVTAAQAVILIVLGPMFAAMLALFVFRGMTKSWGNGGGAVASAPAPQPNFLYPNNMPY